ncbi:MAG TPA: hypothetical protein VFW44_04925 [Bryobacteraceae bacterium]|nr:hypothetical protein [Bryobacteraceae bacterium]
MRRRTACAVLTQLSVYALAPMLLASPPLWKSQGPVDTKTAGYVAAISPSGEMAVAAISTNSGSNKGGTCPAPTLKLGNPAVESSCVTKLSSSNQPLFSVQIGGATIYAIALDGAGNVAVAGDSLTDAGFSTTPGAYETKPQGNNNPILCKLRASDGHPLFCTYIDVQTPGGAVGYDLAVDAAGNTYIAGGSVIDNGVAVEQLNPAGTARVYLTSVESLPDYTDALSAAVDAAGDLYCLCGGLYELNPSGTLIASLDLNGEQSIAVALDAAGNPEALLQDISTGNYRLRKYTAGLSMLIFDTPLITGNFASTLSLQIDSSGVADIFGETPAVNLTQVNPTQPCLASAPNSSNAFLMRVGANGDVLQSTYLQQLVNNGQGAARTALALTTSGASAIFWAPAVDWAPDVDVTKMTLGPTGATIALACAGNGASFAAMPLAPNEITSLFGAGIGPATPVSTKPGASDLYPVEAGDFQVTFDGVPAPLLYASSSQLNVVTPGALAGKSSTHICAVQHGSALGCIDIPVQAAAPGIFTSGVMGTAIVNLTQTITFPYAAAVNQDGTVNSQQNPAPGGSIVSLYATGLGTVTPSLADGAVTPVPIPSQDLAITAWVCQNQFQVSCVFPEFGPALYAGPAPLEVEGLGQINVMVGGTEQNLIDIEVTLPDGTKVDSGQVGIWTSE